MHELIVVIYSNSDTKQVKVLKSDLRKKGFNIWNDDPAAQGTYWRMAEMTKAIESCNVVIAVMSLPAKLSVWADRELKHALKHQIPIIPVLLEGNPADVIPDDLRISDWMDISSEDKYKVGFEKLLEILETVFSTTPKSKYQLVQHELKQLADQISELRWMRIVSVDGLSHPFHRVDSVNIEKESEEDRIGPISAATLSLAERLAYELGLGNLKFTITVGVSATSISLPLGDGMEWGISISFKDHGSINRILQYFENNSYLAHIVPLLDTPSSWMSYTPKAF